MVMLDIVTRVVNVQWVGGLAVEFGDKDEDAPKPGTTSSTTSMSFGLGRRHQRELPNP
jgi:hypothetical protein